MKRYFSRILIGLVLLSCTSGWAQDGTALDQVQEAALKLARQQSDGLLLEWVSRGKVAGDSLDLRIVNRSYDALTVTLMPGMVFVDESGRYQPFILEEGRTISLTPGQQKKLSGLRAYNLDHSRGPRPQGQRRAYKTVVELKPYTAPVKALWAGVRRDFEGRMKPVVNPVLHKTIVLQRAVWASLGEPNPASQEKLENDLMDDAISGHYPFDEKKIEWIAEGLWKDVSATLETSEKE